MAGNYSFFYQLQNADYATIASRGFKFGVVDADDSKLTNSQLLSLAASGKSLLAYASAGEAETFRSYWTNNNWDNSKPSFIIGADPNWSTAYRVKFWDPSWQKVVIDRLKSLQSVGYHGAYLDVVDAYTIPDVQAAFSAEHPGESIREAMSSFVQLISSTLKGIDPNFKIMVQNAVALLNKTDIGSLSEALNPDTAYLHAIDGLGKESTFTLGDTYPISWGAWDARYVENAINAGKLVMSLEYPTLGNAGAEDYAYTHALAAGYIPYQDVRDHTGQFVNFSHNNNGLSGLSSGKLAQLSSFASAGSLPTGADYATINGTSGSEVVSGDLRHDMIHAGAGNDSVFGNVGNDTLYGDEGADKMDGGVGNDVINGGAGNDNITGNFGADLVHGGVDNDAINYTNDVANLMLFGDEGGDSIVAGYGNDTIFGGAGAASPVDGNDTIDGGGGNDAIYANGGDDRIIGSVGRDTVYGGLGNDYIDYRADTAVGVSLWGNDGNDTIIGGNSISVLSGGKGNDSILGSSGNDVIYGGDGIGDPFDGNDTIDGSGGNDLIYSNAGNDYIVGSGGNDSVNAGIGNDLLDFTHSPDAVLLLGNQGNDTMVGGSGNDTLHGGYGADRMTGNGGADLFSPNARNASTTDAPDVITDFTQGTDHINLQRLGFTGVGTTASGTILGVSTSDGMTHITGAGSDHFQVDLIGTYNLTASDFLF